MQKHNRGECTSVKWCLINIIDLLNGINLLPVINQSSICSTLCHKISHKKPHHCDNHVSIITYTPQSAVVRDYSDL
jgi:hypothetical protein